MCQGTSLCLKHGKREKIDLELEQSELLSALLQGCGFFSRFLQIVTKGVAASFDNSTPQQEECYSDKCSFILQIQL